MEAHQIKISKIDGGKTLGVCAGCGERRQSAASDSTEAKKDIEKQFEGHDCSKPALNKTREGVN